jgi:DNA polymerase-1
MKNNIDPDFQAIIDKLSKARQVEKPVLQPKVLLVDAMNTFLRSFAIINHINPKGNHIGGLTGFLKSMGYAIKHINPTRVVIVFEGEGSTLNKKNLFPDYKGNRKLKRITNFDGFGSQEEESESIENQLLRLVEYLQCLPVDLAVVDRVEADDTIAHLSNELQKTSDVVIMSSDQDFLQLVNDKVTVYSPTKKKFYNTNKIKEEYGLPPQNYLQMKILLGDSSDNIPGVPKLGPKKLLKNFPELQEEQTVVLKEILEKSKQTKGTMYESVSMFSHQLKINEKLMDLHNPNLSEMMKLEIQNVIECPKSTMDKTKFLNMYNMDFLGNSIPNVESWLINVFTHLLSSKK